MASYAVSAGISIPVSVLAAIDAPPAPGEDGEIVRLSVAHEQLVRIIAPTRPSLVMALAEGEDQAGALRVLGRVLLVRYKMLVALGSLAAFIALSLTGYINDETNGHIFESSGVPLLVCELFFLSAAGLGASFAGLFQADREIMAGTFDPRHQSSYWTRFLLGLIAGLLLATLLDVHGSGASHEGRTESSIRLTEAALALLGGFSSSVVFRILHRLVETLETMVRGGLDDTHLAKQQVAEAKLGQRLVQERTKLVQRLSRLQQDLAADPDPKRAREQLDALTRGLLEGDLEHVPGAPKPQVSLGQDHADAAEVKAELAATQGEDVLTASSLST
jgi:hypothetical protein